MVNRQQEWFLIVLTTGIESSIMTILCLLYPFLLFPLHNFHFPNTSVFLELQIYGFILNSSFILAFHLDYVYISCRAPNPDTVLILLTPLGVISTKSLLQNKKKAGSRLISSNNRTKVEDTPPADNTGHEPFSAARCRIFQRTNHTKKVTWRMFLFLLEMFVRESNIKLSLLFILCCFPYLYF